MVPVAWRDSVGSLLMTKPGVVFGMSSTDRPPCLLSASVRTSMAMTVSFAAAPLHHSFWPETIQSPFSSRRARVLVFEASEPASGSEIDTEKRILPSINGLMYLSFCAAVPYLPIFIAVNVGTSTAAAKSKPNLPRPSAIRV